MKKVIKLLIGEQPTSEMERLPKDNPPAIMAMFWVSNVQFSPMSNFRGGGSQIQKKLDNCLTFCF